MSTRTRSVLFTSLALSSLFAFGCGAADSTPATNSDVGTNAAALDETNGGLAPTNETPGFGDPAVLTLPDLTTVYADRADITMSLPPDMVAAASTYHVAILWGHLPQPHDADGAPDVVPSPIDWTGEVSVDNGAIALKRTLAFEADDSVDPRSVPQIISFTSHTEPSVDGLFLRVWIPAGQAPTLHFKTAALTSDIDLSTLVTSVGAETRLPGNINGMVYVGYPDNDNCARGLLFGQWSKLAPALGVLRGRVLDGEGATLGFMRGIWGHAPKHDTDLFFVKYIDLKGTFHSFGAGTYDDGQFDGTWSGPTQAGYGFLGGFYNDGAESGEGQGLWLGRWSEVCGI